MEVTHVRDHVTHAVIGGGEVIDFGIANSAEFFDILSSTLYTNQKLAVIREVLCNGWDSHIEAGKTNVPLEITLTSQSLIIKDFGVGIPHEMMGRIYGTYGNSTKKQNGEVTGGFGLGSKAPFAYTEHFEVVSSHNGKRTIYRLTKSSAEAKGKPGIVPIATFPTTDSGLQITIPLKTPSDYGEFQALIKHVVYNGEMLVNFNTELLETFKFSEVQEGFVLTERNPLVGNSRARICVRYGNVIYPLEQAVEINSEYKQALERFQTMTRSSYWSNSGYYLILLAEPNTISVTPSRESLSMQEHTIETVRGLLTAFTKSVESTYREYAYEVTHKSINMTGLVNSVGVLFNPKEKIPNIDKVLPRQKLQRNITDKKHLSAYHLSLTYPAIHGFVKKELIARLNAMIGSGSTDRGLVQSFRRYIFNHQATMIGGQDWFKRNVAWRLFKKIDAFPLTNRNALLVYGKSQTKDKHGWDRESTYEFHNPMKFYKKEFREYLPFLRNIIVLSHNRTSVQDRLAHFPIFKNWFGTAQDVLVYIVPRHVEREKEIKKFFADLGMTVVDLTKIHSFEPNWVKEAAETPKVKAEPKPKKVGIPKLSAMAYVTDGGHNHLNSARLFNEDVERIEKPKYVIKYGKRASNESPFNVIRNDEIAHRLLAEYGPDTGVCITTAQFEKFTEAGAVDLETAILEEVSNTVINDPEVRTYLSAQYGFANDRISCLEWGKSTLLAKLFEIEDLLKEFNFPTIQDTKKLLLADTWVAFPSYERRHDSRLETAYSSLKKLPVHKSASDLFNAVNQSKLISLFDTSYIPTIKTMKTNTRKEAIALLLLAL